jgi:hypothetical protein
MKSTRAVSCLFAFACTLATLGCRHTANRAAQSKEVSASQAQAAVAQAQPASADAQTQPNAQTQSAGTSGQMTAGNGSAPSASASPPLQTAAPGSPPQAAAPASTRQDAQTAHSDQLSPNVQSRTGVDDSVQNDRPELTIPEGTPVEVRLTDPLGSARNVEGQSFAATLDVPIVVGDAVVVPRGANVRGRVLYAKRSGRLRGPAELSITLTSLDLGGREYGIVTAHKSWRGRSHKKRNFAWIGGGAGAGSLVGVAAGGGIGAAVGAGIGAGGGTVTALVTGRKNIVLPSETRVYFVLRRPVTI